MSMYEVVGWTGSVLVVVSLMVPSVRRFRWLNFAGSLLATVYNAVFAIWPFFAMNLAITLIDAYWIVRLERGARRGRDYSLVPIGVDEPYLAHLLDLFREDIHRWYPSFVRAAGEGRRAFLVLHGAETIGVVVAEVRGRAADVVLDLVAPRFRDFTPGRFVYGARGLTDLVDVDSLRVLAGTTTDPSYFERVGFVGDGADLALVVGATSD